VEEENGSSDWSRAKVRWKSSRIPSRPLFKETREPNQRGVARGVGAHHDRGVGVKNGVLPRLLE
jgi:hypothetical protein